MKESKEKTGYSITKKGSKVLEIYKRLLSEGLGGDEAWDKAREEVSKLNIKD